MFQLKKILFVYEANEKQQQALESAIMFIKKYQATLTVISVIPESYLMIDYRLPKTGSISNEYKNMILEEEQKKLNELLEKYKGLQNIETKIIVGEKFIEVIKEVTNNNFDMVMKVAEQSSWIEKHFTSEDMHLLRKCPVPVWIIQNQSDNQYNNILTAIDFDLYSNELADKELNLKLKDISITFTQMLQAKLHVLHAWEPTLEKLMRRYGSSVITDSVTAVKDEEIKREKAMEEFKKEFSNIPYMYNSFEISRKPIVEAISEALNRYKIDLVIMGTVGRTGIDGYFMGNTAETILNQLECSVLALKPTGFMTPITPSLNRTNFNTIINNH